MTIDWNELRKDIACLEIANDNKDITNIRFWCDSILAHLQGD